MSEVAEYLLTKEQEAKTLEDRVNKLEGKPIFAANMFTTGTFEMARELQKHQMFIMMKEWQIFSYHIFLKRIMI